MHGGKSPGAPRGNSNALKHGRYSAEAIARRQEISSLIRAMRALAIEVEKPIFKPRFVKGRYSTHSFAGKNSDQSRSACCVYRPQEIRGNEDGENVRCRSAAREVNLDFPNSGRLR